MKSKLSLNDISPFCSHWNLNSFRAWATFTSRTTLSPIAPKYQFEQGSGSVSGPSSSQNATQLDVTQRNGFKHRNLQATYSKAILLGQRLSDATHGLWRASVMHASWENRSSRWRTPCGGYDSGYQILSLSWDWQIPWRSSSNDTRSGKSIATSMTHAED